LIFDFSKCHLAFIHKLLHSFPNRLGIFGCGRNKIFIIKVLPLLEGARKCFCYFRIHKIRSDEMFVKERNHSTMF